MGVPGESISHVTKMLVCDMQWCYLRYPGPLFPLGRGKIGTVFFLRGVKVIHLS